MSTPSSTHAAAPRSIRNRIGAVFALSLGMFTAALVYGLVQLRNIGEGLTALDAGYLPLASISAQLDAVARQLDRDLDRAARELPRPLAGHRSNAAFHNTSLTEGIRRGHSSVRAAAARITAPEDHRALEQVRVLLDEIDAHREAHHDAAQRWLDAGSEGPDTGRALLTLDTERTALVLKVDELSQLVAGHIQRLSARTAKAQDRALAVSGTLSLLAILLAGVMAAVGNVTLRPIGLLTAQVQRLAQGRDAGPVAVRTGDEIGVLAREFNAMAQAVAERDRRLKERAAVLDRLSLYLRRVLDTIQAGLVVAEESRAVMVNPAARGLWKVEEGAALPERLGALEHGRYEALPFGERLLDVDVVPFGERGVVLVGEDVTGRVQVRERLARAQRLAMVGQMLAQITHEVRNPLNAMSLNAELLGDDLHEPEQVELLETITGEIARLEQLTARYLELSRGRQPELTAADPAEMVRDVLRVEAAALERAGVRHGLTADGPGVVEFDADALRRAVRNVVLNAAEAGARRLAVRVSTAEREITVEIADDGPGMSPLETARAFEPFFTTKARGTGLGLAISRQELEDVGGSISVRTVTGGGSVFELRVPFEV